MVRIETSPPPEAIRQGARHTLFVEGNSPKTIDPEALSELLADTKVTIRPLGAAFHIKSVAEALHPYHSDYYFLIDRDHQDLTTVEKTWQNFPDKTTHNLLIWKRRELENYFITPEYLMRSSFLNCPEDEVRENIISAASKNVFRDAANLAIVGVREKIKEKWVETFESPIGFETKDAAINKIRKMSEFSTKTRSIAQTLRKDGICKRFDKIVDELLGGQVEPQFGSGTWLERLRGKHLLPSIINHCCTVRAASGAIIQGEQAVLQVVKDLLRKPLAEQPNDFQELHKLISDRIASS